MPAEALAQAGVPSGLGGLDRPFLFESSKITLLCLMSMINKVSNVFFEKKDCISLRKRGREDAMVRGKRLTCNYCLISYGWNAATVHSPRC